MADLHVPVTQRASSSLRGRVEYTQRKWWEILRAWDMNRMCIWGANRDINRPPTTLGRIP